MKNRKINLDRPPLGSSEISARKNFDQVLTNYQLMVKPFYQQNWFIGTAGLASLSLIIGGSLALQGSDNPEHFARLNFSTDAPPHAAIQIYETINVADENKHINATEQNETKEVFIQKETPIEETITPQKTSTPKKHVKTPSPLTEPVVERENVREVQKNLKEDAPIIKSSWLSISPKISNKMGGTISKDELFDLNGIITEGDVSIVHFELHLINYKGGTLMKEDGNQLSKEMIQAINDLKEGEIIYFENIKGQSKAGTELRLNPLKFTLQN